MVIFMKYLLVLFMLFSTAASADRKCPETEFYKWIMEGAIDKIIPWEPTGEQINKMIPDMNKCYEETGFSCADSVVLLPSGRLAIDCREPY